MFNTPIYNDTIYNKLQNETKRDKILEGTLAREQCNDDNVFKFIKLLKLLVGREINKYFKPISVEE